MTLQISTVTDISSEQLSKLIVDNLDAIVGDGGKLWETVPRMGENCLVAVGRDQDLTLISFHAKAPERALLTGLGCMDQLNDELATVLLGNHRKPSRLLVLSPAPPPGIGTLSQCAFVTARTFKVVEVKGERGLLLEEPAEKSSSAVTAMPDRQEARAPEAGEPELTKEEEEFFAEV